MNGEYLMTATLAGGMAAGLMHEVNNVTWMTRAMLDVSLNPDPSQLPGGGTLADLTNGLAGFVLILALFGMVVSAGGWGLGVATSNMAWAERGKSGTIVCALAALLVGAAAIIINFFFHVGSRLH